MDRRGESTGDNLLTNYVMYFLFLAVFLVITLNYIFGLQHGISLKEDFYVKELARIINEAEPTQEVRLDVQDVSDLAIKEKQPLSDIFTFDNVNHKVHVKLSSRTGRSYSYFNDVIIVNPEIENGVLHFIITKETHVP